MRGTWRPKTLRGMRSLGRRLAARLSGGDVVALVGDLGAGKTSFVQGLAEGLGVQDVASVVSPTYTLVNVYPAAGWALHHIDLYRLDSVADAQALGIDEQLGCKDAICAVEWADRAVDIIPQHAFWVRIAFAATGRLVEFSGGA